MIEAMWRDLLCELDPTCELAAGATTEQITDLERTLGVELPDELHTLLEETNGAFREDGQHLIWSTDEMVEWNQQLWTHPGYRETYMPLDCLLFFSDAGVDGIKFALGLVQRKVPPIRHIYAWYPIDDGRPWVADSVRRYLEWWLTGKLKI